MGTRFGFSVRGRRRERAKGGGMVGMCGGEGDVQAVNKDNGSCLSMYC